jgi:hypothetical protein
MWRRFSSGVPGRNEVRGQPQGWLRGHAAPRDCLASRAFDYHDGLPGQSGSVEQQLYDPGDENVDTPVVGLIVQHARQVLPMWNCWDVG